MREEPLRIAGRLEATLRIPDVTPLASVVIAHYFVGRHREVGAVVAERIARVLRLPSPLP